MTNTLNTTSIKIFSDLVFDITCDGKKLVVKIRDDEYILWSSIHIHLVNIQKKDDFNSSNNSNKIGIKIIEPNISFCYDNSTFGELDTLSLTSKELLTAIMIEVKKIVNSNVNTIFNNKLICVLLNYLLIKTHNNNNPLTLCDYKIWYCTIVSRGNHTILNIQKTDKFIQCAPDYKIGIRMDMNIPNIDEVYIDSSKASTVTLQDTLYNNTHEWYISFSKILSEFLIKYCVVLQDIHIYYHPIVLDESPETLLNKIMEHYTITTLPHIKVGVYNDRFISEVIDAGGPSKQMYCDLLSSLFDNSKKRMLTIENNYPCKSKNNSLYTNTLINIGKLLTYIYSNRLFHGVGRIFPDELLTILKMAKKTPQSRDYIMLVCDKDINPLMELYLKYYTNKINIDTYDHVVLTQNLNDSALYSIVTNFKSLLQLQTLDSYTITENSLSIELLEYYLTNRDSITYLLDIIDEHTPTTLKEIMIILEKYIKDTFSKFIEASIDIVNSIPIELLEDNNASLIIQGNPVHQT